MTTDYANIIIAVIVGLFGILQVRQQYSAEKYRKLRETKEAAQAELQAHFMRLTLETAAVVSLIADSTDGDYNKDELVKARDKLEANRDAMATAISEIAIKEITQ